MANLRDGGIIVLGLSETGTTWTLSGISEEHLTTYDPDRMLDLVNAYASPYITIDVATDKAGSEFDGLQVNDVALTNIDDDQAGSVQRRKHRRAGADDDMGNPGTGQFPGPLALGIGGDAVDDLHARQVLADPGQIE